MARVADHLSVEDLEARLRSAQDPTATRHFQVIRLLARGHTIADVAAVTSFVPRWIEQLLARYNAHGPEALGDLRRRNGSAPSVLRPELLALFCREAGAGRERMIVLGLDSAGWHTEPNLVVPDGIRLAYLPPYSPELQPAEHLWPVLDEPLANQYIETLADLERAVAERCLVLDGDQISLGTNFHWWPKPTKPS